ncbi:MAG: hypothetical protein COY81_00565 [Candidatus Pacebacteria bacterium CG_4_10_14_0_8_um_filter_43_12]|nr:MAG: hypothetical protein COU66_02545 [Candidatus Pacebacteria bacterium CG10_big_fil_rev_8_21_14_0_10_44_11]PIY79821.1 MAG: hypothetical protein COY81_00565 [Candidatus Pacebacteria bacterium CG_4_10_14_0_8_um_filter_43_12]
MSLSVSIHTEATIFAQLKDEWLALLDRSITNYLFQTPQFQAAWWQTLGAGKLQLIVLRTAEGKLVGLAPFFISAAANNKDELCFVGCVNVSDYLDLLVDKEHQTEVYQTLAQVLTTQLTSWKAFYFCSLPAASPTRNWLKQTFLAAQEQQQDVSPFINLPASWEKYLAQLDRKQRHEIRRKLHRLAEVDHQFELISLEEEVLEALPDFIKLHQASSAKKKDFWDGNHLRFFSTFIPQAAKAGWLRLHFLKLERKRVAAMLGFAYNGQFLLYNSGFDPTQFNHLGTGTLLTAHTIQVAIANQNLVYDFLRGDEEYKFRFGATSKPVFDISLTKN